ncbi:hypothetical protein K1719_031102 [Acacia pycnantha]|nr:hypothetical protein K1719_031102 [Acacia pycnantha]
MPSPSPIASRNRHSRLVALTRSAQEASSGTGDKLARCFRTYRYDSLKKEWRVCDKLFAKETGISYDSVNHKVIAEDEWWDRKIQENPDYAKYRYHGIKFARELEIVFKDGMASGSTQFSPSARRQMPPRDDEDDVYRPTMDLEEGSGDSEEELPGATTGVSAL